METCPHSIAPMHRIACAVLVLACAFSNMAATADEPLRVAVAANFQAAFAVARQGFPRALEPSYGSSGLLYAQIVQGRPFDVFLSADRERPMALVRAGRARGAVVYARGRLALLANEGRPGAAWLVPGRRVALANPATAPYGRAAQQALWGLGAGPRVVTALNVAQAFHFALSGAADGAFVAMAQVVARDVPRERYWVVPEDLHAPIEQVAVAIAMEGSDAEGAQALLDHLVRGDTQARIRAAGYR